MSSAVDFGHRLQLQVQNPDLPPIASKVEPVSDPPPQINTNNESMQWSILNRATYQDERQSPSENLSSGDSVDSPLVWCAHKCTAAGPARSRMQALRGAPAIGGPPVTSNLSTLNFRRGHYAPAISHPRAIMYRSPRPRARVRLRRDLGARPNQSSFPVWGGEAQGAGGRQGQWDGGGAVGTEDRGVVWSGLCGVAGRVVCGGEGRRRAGGGGRASRRRGRATATRRRWRAKS